MVITTERSRPEQHLVDALRASFDASVMNFGAYNILCTMDLEETPDAAEPVADPAAYPGERPGPLLLVGYRREPVEIVLCPVDLEEALERVAALQRGETPAAATPLIPKLVNLTNLAGMATQDNIVELALSTGRRVKLDLHGQVRFEQFPDIVLHQRKDVEHFYEFIDYFMDTVEDMDAA
ncbi:hypothetical protein [Nesterenkonia lutea]|uniref:Uncharacterized protein n=1 Tax=Nesterenkonia lutea TaxID=272919 RepID=A0ABR9JD24_9MICC|nr:hypothetical protein [Nesterenkonia lutea]MBE1523680.1 hypothetical protein [Nesterenkonia lutea]